MTLVSDDVARCLTFTPRDQLERFVAAVDSVFRPLYHRRWPDAKGEDCDSVLRRSLQCASAAYEQRMSAIRRRRDIAEAASHDHTLADDEAAEAAHAVVECDREAPRIASSSLCAGLSIALMTLDPADATDLMRHTVWAELERTGIACDESVVSADVAELNVAPYLTAGTAARVGLSWLTAVFGQVGVASTVARVALAATAAEPPVALLSVRSASEVQLLHLWADAIDNAAFVEQDALAAGLFAALPDVDAGAIIVVDCGDAIPSRSTMAACRGALAPKGAGAAPMLVLVSRASAAALSPLLDHATVLPNSGMTTPAVVGLALRFEAERAFLPLTAQWMRVNRVVATQADEAARESTAQVWVHSAEQQLTKAGPMRNDPFIVEARRRRMASRTLGDSARAHIERCIDCLRAIDDIATALEHCGTIVRETGGLSFDAGAQVALAARHLSEEAALGAQRSIVLYAPLDDDALDTLRGQARDAVAVMAERLVDGALAQSHAAFVRLLAKVWRLRQTMNQDPPRSPSKSALGEPQLAFLDTVVDSLVAREVKRRADAGQRVALSESELATLCERRIMSLRAQAAVLGLAPEVPLRGVDLSDDAELTYLHEHVEWKRRVGEVRKRFEGTLTDSRECQLECILAAEKWDRATTADPDAVGLAVGGIENAIDNLCDGMAAVLQQLAAQTLIHARVWNDAARRQAGTLRQLTAADGETDPAKLVAVRTDAADTVRRALKLEAYGEGICGVGAASLAFAVSEVRSQILGSTWVPEAPTDVLK